jgi:ligand-binding sensor domain-containing protein
VSALQARTLWELGDPEYRFRDATPPDRTTDLRVIGHQVARNATIEFTAPGDLGLTESAGFYVFRWGPDSVTETNWYSLPTAAFLAEEVGTRVTLTIKNLPASGRHIIAMRAVDKLGNLSPVSNSVTTENILQSGWTYFDSDNSPLPDNEITALYIDSKNRAWVGTDFGVTVVHAGGGETYDASAHSILSQRVTAISEDATGRIVVGSRSGAASFDGNTWRTVWPLGPETQDRESRCIFPADDGTVWLGVGFNGVVEIDDQSWESHNSSNSGIRGSIVRRMAGSSDGSIWFGADQGLSRLRDGTWTALGTTGTVTSILIPDPETILYGTYDGMLHCISHGIERTPIKMWPQETWPRQSAAIGDIVQSGDGSIWLSTYGSIRRYNVVSLGESFVLLPSISGLPEREITALAAGSDNTLWIGTKNSGVCRWDLTAAGMPASTTTLSSNR